MPAPISRVFELTERDLAGTHWGPYYDVNTETDTDASMESFEQSHRVLVDHTLYLTHATVRANPGAGQSVLRLGLKIENEARTRVFRIFKENNDGAGWGAGVEIYIDRQLDILLVPGRHFLIGFATFDAGANANTCALSQFGYYMPKSNAIPGF